MKIEKEHRKSTLMSWEKQQLVELIMCLEHNNNELNERLDQQAINFEKLSAELAEYKSTGLTPDQMVEMDRLYAEKCKELAELQENSVLPCKIGDAIWDNDFGMPRRYTVIGFDIGIAANDEENHEEWYIYYQNHNGSIRCNASVSEIGKTVFLTREEAFKKMQEDNAGSSDTE